MTVSLNQADIARRAIAKAAEIFDGSEAALARKAGYSQNAIWSANKKGRITLEMAIRIEAATDGRVPRWVSRPDAFSAPKSASLDSTDLHAGEPSPRPIPDIAGSPPSDAGQTASADAGALEQESAS